MCRGWRVGRITFHKDYDFQAGDYTFIVGKGGVGIITSFPSCNTNMEGNDTTISSRTNNLFQALGGGSGGFTGYKSAATSAKEGGSSGGQVYYGNNDKPQFQNLVQINPSNRIKYTTLISRIFI